MTTGNDDKKTLPVCMKRCSKCKLPRPRSEVFFPLYFSNPGYGPSLHSACRICPAWYQRMVRARRKLEDPEGLRARERRFREARKADRERSATARVYGREWLRAKRGTVAREDESLIGVRVASFPVRSAVEGSGLTLADIAGMTGRDREGLKRSLAAELMTGACAVAVLEALRLSPSEVGL